MIWRIIDDGPRSAVFNMSLDEAISEAVRKKLSPPTLRLYQWDKPSVSIGYFQRISDIDLQYCGAKRYPLVRRPTGGMAVLHSSELTYSFSAQTGLEAFKGGLLKNYLAISGALVSALRALDLDARITLSGNGRHRSPLCFKTPSYGEITVRNEKIIGSAQKRYKNGFLQHGSILMDPDVAELHNVLKKYKPDRDICAIGT
ncbi:MAG TPA: lipoate--protein ligase family protein, partial [Nitrospirae bacterium]|nr:lipoate--protein ligase family protein [Nitrospirota bacterium]